MPWYQDVLPRQFSLTIKEIHQVRLTDPIKDIHIFQDPLLCTLQSPNTSASQPQKGW